MVASLAVKKDLNKNHENAQARLVEMSSLVDASKGAMTEVAEYQKTLKELQVNFREAKATIEALLPGATSSGLAVSFRDQKQRFYWPRLIWLATFIISMGTLIGPAIGGVTGHVDSKNTEEWDYILKFLVQRLPIVAPFVWLAFYAGRQYSIAARMEEDYAYKEELSRAFEGYKREMGGISKRRLQNPDPRGC